MPKVVVNKCYGGFSLSKLAMERLGLPIPEKSAFGMYFPEMERDDPRLVAVIEELGDKANGACAKLRVIEVPDGQPWEIDEYDGLESVVAPIHRFG